MAIDDAKSFEYRGVKFSVHYNGVGKQPFQARVNFDNPAYQFKDSFLVQVTGAGSDFELAAKIAYEETISKIDEVLGV